MEKIANMNNEKLQKINNRALMGGTAVLVTDQFRCERLIRCGRLAADITRSDLYVINLQSSDVPSNPEAIQHLFDVTTQHGGIMQLLYSDHAFRTISDYIKENKISCVVSGTPGSANSILHQLWGNFPRVHFFTVNENGKMEEVIYRKNHGIHQESDARELNV